MRKRLDELKKSEFRDNNEINLGELEEYEWCDFWWQEAKDRLQPRILLIGDSITRGYRPFVEEQLGETNKIDMIATSKAIDNPAFKRDISYFIEQYSTEYCLIHFNNGLHGFHVKINDYLKYLEDMILFIQKNCRKSKLILATSTPVLNKGSLVDLDEGKNNIVLERNLIVFELAQKYQLEVNDLYTEMLGKNEYRLEDGLHYNECGQKVQGSIVAKFVEKLLEM